MKNFGIGLGIGLAGLAVWLGSSIIGGMAEAFQSAQPWFGKPLMFVGFSIMLLGPFVFWIILPIRNRRRKE